MKTSLQHFLFSVFFIIFQTYVHASPAVHHQPILVEDFVAKQKIIRTYEDNTPNFGDLATTISTMDRLREMGFKGVFEFIYIPEYHKIPVLFNLPDNIPADYFDKEKNIRFITYAEYSKYLKENKVPLVTLSFASGGFPFADTLKSQDPSITWNPETSPYTNEAYMLKSKAALILTVWMEKGCNSIAGGGASEIYLDNMENNIPLCRSPEQFLVAPFITYVQAKSYLQSNTEGQRLVKQKPALTALLNVLDNQSANMLFVYGHGLPNCTDDDNIACESKDRYDLQGMLGVISGARYAQMQQKDNSEKPVIIVVFKSYQQTAHDLAQIINHKQWNQYDFDGKQQAMETIEKQQISSQFDIANITDKDAEQKLLHLQPGQILLLTLGKLPKIVFDGIYNHTANNIWPAIREGENAKNSLVLNGKPHMRMTSVPGEEQIWEPSAVGFGPNNFDPNNTLNQKFNNLVFQTEQFWTKLQPTELIGNYILEAQDANSSLSKYFAWLKEQALKPENDRIYSGLEETIKALNNSGSDNSHITAHHVTHRPR